MQQQQQWQVPFLLLVVCAAVCSAKTPASTYADFVASKTGAAVQSEGYQSEPREFVHTCMKEISNKHCMALGASDYHEWVPSGSAQLAATTLQLSHSSGIRRSFRIHLCFSGIRFVLAAVKLMQSLPSSYGGWSGHEHANNSLPTAAHCINTASASHLFSNSRMTASTLPRPL
jgi:hypothetical protein